MATGTNINITVSGNRLNAWVRVNPQVDFKAITPAFLRAALEESRIVSTPAVDARLDELCQLLQAGSLPEGDFLVAQGMAPVAPVDARFEWDQVLHPQFEDHADQTSRVNHYDRHSITPATKGAVLGRMIPAQTGQPGIDVHGNAIPSPGKPRQIRLLANVDMAADGTVVALCDGCVVFDGDRISVTPVLEILGDVDFGIGNIDTHCDVVIRGSVKDLFHVRSARDITIGGHVDAADIEAGGSILIHGGIHGHGKATVRAAGRIEARICDGASIDTRDVFIVQRECINCRVAAESISSPASTIIGGYTWARNGIEVQNLGSPAAVKTFVSVGVPVKVMDQAAQMLQEAKGCLDNAGKIRQAVEPLVRKMCCLSPQQRERVTHLARQADALEQQARDLDTKRERLLAEAAADAEPAIAFGGRMHAGVTVVINGRSTTIELGNELRGPIRIMERSIEGVTTLVAIDSVSGSMRPLPTTRFSPEAERQAARGAEPVESQGGAE